MSFRQWIVALGLIIIVAYSLTGAMLMNVWAVEAASGEPLDQTISAMEAAGQPYTPIFGFVYAGFGASLGIAWAYLSLRFGRQAPGWALGALWAGIVMMGAPAYFAGSFGNLMSVGDTYFDWNSDAAWARESLLYLVSGIAVVFGIVCVAAPFFSRARARRPRAVSTLAAKR